MRKTISILLAAAVAASLLTACGISSPQGISTEPPAAKALETARAPAQVAAAEPPAPAQATETVSEPGAGQRILIAYFAVAENSDVDATSSASVVPGTDKGLSRYIAEMIAERTGGELFSIQTEVKYPGKYDPLADYAKQEQNDGVLPALTSHIDRLEDYDVIFIGYPIWWYTLPQAMFSFFDEYDFTGKTIIPFNTHYGSRDGGTYKRIAELEPGATVLDGYNVNQRDIETCEKDVQEWLGGLGY